MRNKQSLVFLASSLFLLLLAPITSEAISNPSTNINEVNREIVEESANDQATSAASHSETLEQESSLGTTTTTDNHPAETDQSTATLEPSKQQKDDDNSATESAIVEPQPRMLLRHTLLHCLMILISFQSTRYFKSQLEMQQVF